jgi:hypothetical protein
MISIVRPPYKKGDKTSMSNYRPISLLTIFSKVFEKVMHSKLSHYLQTNNIQIPEQYDFRKGISAENSAFKLTDIILKSINKKCMLVEYSDLAKAFDCINQEILLIKIHCLGIQRTTVSWFRSYLTDKKQD